MNADIFYRRAYFFIIFIIVVFFIFFIRLIFIQLVDSTFKDRSKSNALLFQTIYPARGVIYDRNGVVLTYNHPHYDILVVTKNLSQDFDTVAFCSLLHIKPLEYDSIIKRIKNRNINKGFSPYTQQLFMNNLTYEEIIAVEENIHRFKGFFLQKKYNRGYTYPFSCSHILGSVAEVNSSELKNDNYYQMGDLCGKEGIEKYYEKTLRGDKGVSVLLRDSKGRIKGQYKNGSLDKEAISGKDLTLTIDIKLQLLAEKILQNKVGSVVAIEPQSGEILTMASAPSYDLGTLDSKMRNTYYTYLLNDPNKPLLNRSVYATYSPGSTFKIIQALLCLQEEIITPQTFYQCNGPLSSPIKCTHYHGTLINVLSAIEQSCNPFFWNAFRDFLQKNGYGQNNENFKQQYEKWRNYVMAFGLGHLFEKSDISNQSPGNIPSVNWYDNVYGETGWKALTIRSLSIGQGEVLVTPLQLANLASIIANNGNFIPPHLNKTNDFYKFGSRVNIAPEHFSIVKQGMRNVMRSGTGHYYDIPSLDFCGKTGTVENNNGKDHALFIGFAPKDDPKIAIAVVIENAGFGATWAVPVASLLMEYYLTGKISNKELLNKLIESNLIEK